MALALFGLTKDQFQGARPELNDDEELAMSVWAFIGGWFPERLPIACIVFDVGDVPGLVQRLLKIRATIAERPA